MDCHRGILGVIRKALHFGAILLGKLRVLVSRLANSAECATVLLRSVGPCVAGRSRRPSHDAWHQVFEELAQRGHGPADDEKVGFYKAVVCQ